VESVVLGEATAGGGPVAGEAPAGAGTATAAGGGRPGLWVGGVVAAVGVVALLGVAAATSPGLGLADAALLGVVEGVTEWLPISSTGHLTVTNRLLDLDGAAADSYAISIQAGAMLAVLGLYRHRFATMVHGVTRADEEGRHLIRSVCLACLPAVAVGLLGEDVIKEHLFGVWPIAVAWAVGGAVILVTTAAGARRRSGLGAPLTDLGARAALAIGAAQAIALWPGVSRSLVTILAAGAVGLSLRAAIEFSFLLGFVTLTGATLHEVVSSGGDMVDTYGLVAPLVGLVVAFATSVVAMRWMVDYLARHSLAVFGWYRLAAAAVAATLLLTNVI
jgi:undecaprenyl-diphosphatase